MTTDIIEINNFVVLIEQSNAEKKILFEQILIHLKQTTYNQ